MPSHFKPTEKTCPFLSIGKPTAIAFTKCLGTRCALYTPGGCAFLVAAAGMDLMGRSYGQAASIVGGMLGQRLSKGKMD